MTRPNPSKVVYAVTSVGCDRFSAMARASIASLRVTNSSVVVCLTCDTVTAAALEKCNDPLLAEVDEFVTCDAYFGQAAYRSRHVKTRVREIIDGPFLLLDCDTLVRSDLSSVFSIDADIAGAPNHSAEEFEQQLWSEDAKALAEMEWRVGREAYINSGVLFFNDTTAAHQVGSLWHEKWRTSIEKCARHRDQPALNAALFEARPRLAVLPHKFNAQFRVAPHVAENAVIWHFYSSGHSDQPETYFEETVSQLLRGKELRRDIVREIIRRPGPWRQQARKWLHSLGSRFRRAVVKLLPDFA